MPLHDSHASIDTHRSALLEVKIRELQMNLNQEKKSFSTKQGLCYDVYFWNVNYLRYRGTPLHRRMVGLASGFQ